MLCRRLITMRVYFCLCDVLQLKLNVENIASLQSPGSLIPNLDSHFPAAFCVVLFSNSVLSDLSITVLRLLSRVFRDGLCVEPSGVWARGRCWTLELSLLLSLAGSHVGWSKYGHLETACHGAGRTVATHPKTTMSFQMQPRIQNASCQGSLPGHAQR